MKPYVKNKPKLLSQATKQDSLSYFPPNKTQILSKRSTYEILEALEEKLISAVKRRLVSDVPVGIFLSGGIDSTVVAYCASKVNANVKAYIADFKEKSFGEAYKAQKVCQELKIPYKIFSVEPAKEDLESLVKKISYYADEPLADSSSLPVYLLCREASKEVKVVLSGDGGDEFFCGYLTYNADEVLKRLPFFARKALFKLFPLFMSLIPYNEKKVGIKELTERFIGRINLPPAAAHFAWNGTFLHQEKIKLLSSNYLPQQLKDTYLKLAYFYCKDINSPTLDELMQADQKGYLVNDILQKVDRMSMAWGLEVRPLFLDRELASFACSIPSPLHFKNFTRKYLLKEFLKWRCPWYQYLSEKKGFSIPIHQWCRTNLKSFFERLFFKSDNLFNKKELKKLWDK
ncbi:MAG: asparagine synthase, partial [Candidatus Dadabacteria bacterium]